jgi:hypothetical protein
MDTLTSDYKKSLKNPYIEENQTTQCQKKCTKGQTPIYKIKHRVRGTPLKTGG